MLQIEKRIDGQIEREKVEREQRANKSRKKENQDGSANQISRRYTSSRNLVNQ